MYEIKYLKHDMIVEVKRKDTQEKIHIVVENVMYQERNMIFVGIKKEETNAKVLELLEKLQELGLVDNDTEEDAPWELVISPGTADPKTSIIEIKFNQECFELFSVHASEEEAK